MDWTHAIRHGLGDEGDQIERRAYEDKMPICDKEDALDGEFAFPEETNLSIYGNE